MNTLLELFLVKSAYDKGKETGLPGFIGIIVAVIVSIGCIMFWDYIKPILEFLGVINFLDSLGLIYHGDPGLTWLRIIGGILSFYIIAIVIFLILMLFLAILVSFISTKLWKKLSFLLVMAFFWTLVTPIYILFSPLFLIVGIIELFSFIKNPKKYKKEFAERKRLKKKKIELELTNLVGINDQPIENPDYDLTKELVNMTLAENNGELFTPTQKENPNYRENNEITFENASDFLNGLPEQDQKFLIGVTYDRRFFILLPRPLNLNYTTMFSFSAYEIMVEYRMKNKENKRKIQGANDAYELDVKLGNNRIEEVDFKEFEYYFNIGSAEVYLKVFKDVNNSSWYKDYIRDIREQYILKKA